MKNFTKLLFTELLFCSVNLLVAQGTGGRISGKVANSKNEPLIGAAVQVTNTSNGFKTGVITDLDGNYDLAELPLGGPYTLKVSFVGHQEKQITEIMLGLGAHLVKGRGKKEHTRDFATNYTNEHELFVKIRVIRG